MKRRSFLTKSILGGAVVSTGLLGTKEVLAKLPAELTGEKDITKAITTLLGSAGDASDKIKMKAPEVAENGAVVPIDVDATALADVESITIVVEGGNDPVAASFNLSNGAAGFAATRIKMAKSGNVYAVVKAGGKVLKTHKEVKVTIGGCGG